MKARIFENLNEAQSEGIAIDSTWLQYQVDLLQGKVNESGQSEFLVDAIGLNEVQGKPLGASKIEEKVKDLING